MADGLADLTMDNRYSWHKSFEVAASVGHGHLVVQTDGGLREGQCAAAAWIIGVWTEVEGVGKFETLVAHGTFLEATSSVFEAEAIALDEASAEVAQIMRRYTVDK